MQTSPLWISGILAFAALSGCISTMPGDDGQDSGTGHVSFYVKDAPSDEFSSVFVTFSSVEVHRSGDADSSESDAETSLDDSPTTPVSDASVDDGSATTPVSDASVDDGSATTPVEGSSAGWFEIVSTTQTVDLKEFQGDASMFLGGADVEAGHYTQIRIHVDEAYGLKDGARVNFTIPSDTLKIVRPWTVEDGGETALTVDFLLESSIIAKGNGQYSLKPTMKLIVEHPEGDEGDEEEGDDDDSTLADASGRRGGRPDGKGKP